jgi:uncharacterized protein YndB with AHSA1/START domain
MGIKMAQPTVSLPLLLTARRVLKYPPARVFRAWTEASQLKRWFGAGEGFTTPLAEVDLRVGGRYRLGMQPPGSPQVLVVTGEYRQIEPPHRLSFTWRWDGAPPDEPVTLVTVNFNTHPQGTELVLTHERFTSAASRDEHALGWLGCLNQLERALGDSAANSID